jgi:hypothetical protein
VKLLRPRPLLRRSITISHFKTRSMHGICFKRGLYAVGMKRRDFVVLTQQSFFLHIFVLLQKYKCAMHACLQHAILYRTWVVPPRSAGMSSRSQTALSCCILRDMMVSVKEKASNSQVQSMKVNESEVP